MLEETKPINMSSFGASTEEPQAIVYVSVHNKSPPGSIGLNVVLD